MNIKKFVFSGIPALALVFGFVLAGCATDPSPGAEAPADDEVPKTLVITGFNLPMAGKGVIRVELTGDWDDGNTEFTVLAANDAKLNGQTLTAKLYREDGSGNRWTGTGEYSVNVRINTSSGTPEGAEFYRYRYNDDGIHNDVRINIKDAETTLAWSDFKFAWKW